MTDTIRDAFEAWAKSIHLDITPDKSPWGHDIYKHAHVDSMWFSWQAATLAAQGKRQPLTEGDAKEAATAVETYMQNRKETHDLFFLLTEMPIENKEHVTDGGQCWCFPEVVYRDPETDAAVIVHRIPI